MKTKLAMMYASLGAAVSGFKPYAGLALIKHAESRAEEVVRACRHSKAAWHWLERIVSGSDVTSCLIGHGIMLYAIMAQSGRLPKNDPLLQMFGLAEWQVLGTPPPGMEFMNATGTNFNTGSNEQRVATGV